MEMLSLFSPLRVEQKESGSQSAGLCEDGSLCSGTHEKNKGYTWDNLIKERVHDGLCLSLPGTYTSSDKFEEETKEEMMESVLEARDAQRGCEA